MLFGLAYTATCLVNGKKYVGITTKPFEIRVKGHRHASAVNDTKFYRAIRKHGFANFIFEPVACASSEEDLYELERLLIRQFDSFAKGYNSTLGGEGVYGYEATPETRLKFSQLSKERWALKRDTYVESAKRVWANKTPEERERHRERARITFSLPRKPRPKREKPALWKGKGWNMKVKTHCPSGHEYTEDNTRTNHRGSRVCITCKRYTGNHARDNRRMTNRITRMNTADAINLLASDVHKRNQRWWTDIETGEKRDRNVGEMLCLVHSELSEALEGHRKNLQDSHLPTRSMLEVELADAVIRIMDVAAGLGLDLGGAFAEKLEYNDRRADHTPEARKAVGGKAY